MTIKICERCKKQFDDSNSVGSKRFCSLTCSRTRAGIKITGGGGYREGSGRAKTGYYKGIYCGSSYELVWVIYNLDHNHAFARFPGKLTDGVTTYVPDFLIDNNQIIELKGYEKQEKVEAKTKLAESLGYQVTVLRKNDIKHMFDYVKAKYGVTETKVHTLYDGYKPKYSYTCSCCSTTFVRDSKAKTEKVFCSQTCAGKFMFQDPQRIANRKASKQSHNPSTRSKQNQKPSTSSKIPSRQGKGKLSKEDILAIYADTSSRYVIEEKYKVSSGIISLIKNKKAYLWAFE